METKQERTQQQEQVVEVPVWMWLKSERVQEPAEASAAQVEGKPSHVCELVFSRQQPMTIELTEPQIVIHVYETCGSRARA